MVPASTHAVPSCLSKNPAGNAESPIMRRPCPPGKCLHTSATAVMGHGAQCVKKTLVFAGSRNDGWVMVTASINNGSTTDTVASPLKVTSRLRHVGDVGTPCWKYMRDHAPSMSCCVFGMSTSTN